MLNPDSTFIDKELKATRFQSLFHCLVVGIKRKKQTLTSDLANVKLQFGDVLLVCGAWEDILRLRDHREEYLLLTLPEEYKEVYPARAKAPIAIAVIAAMVGAIVFNIFPTITAVLGAALLMILFGCVKHDGVYKAIDWSTLMLIAGILPLAMAVEKTGVSIIVTRFLIATFGQVEPILLLIMIFLLTASIGLFMSNTPTAVLIAPVAVDVGISLNVSPQACAMIVAIACSAAFISPVGSPVTMIVRQPGGYSFFDFVKVGVPLMLLTLVSSVLMAWFIYL
jgi:di/tricarboxylate transporter